MEITEAFLQDALQALKREILSSLHVAMPGIVESYDSSTHTATATRTATTATPAASAAGALCA